MLTGNNFIDIHFEDIGPSHKNGALKAAVPLTLFLVEGTIQIGKGTRYEADVA